MMIKIGIIKIGNIGTSPVIDLILDERADREDIDVRTISSGSKMEGDQVEDILPKIFYFNPDLIIFITPNPNSRQPKIVRERLSKIDIPTIIIGDQPGEKAINKLKEQKLGYIIIRADAMIGARREFLDPTEMALFNADVLKVLSITGTLRLVSNIIDGIIKQIIDNDVVELPEIVVTAELAVFNAGYKNPYAMGKAMAAYKMATLVSEMNIEACFKIKEPDLYIPLVTASHELMSAAAKLADEAREIEKSNDTVLRTPHDKEGYVWIRQSLMDAYK
ncbi:MAG: F420-dependent methylenetetrahydromethanopterin dehydrogenase [Methanosphaera sp.]|nr:F420-dependent methylenetetrahydromethanopterin dehydrogenase [Methanosphaera sp.]